MPAANYELLFKLVVQGDDKLAAVAKSTQLVGVVANTSAQQLGTFENVIKSLVASGQTYEEALRSIATSQASEVGQSKQLAAALLEVGNAQKASASAAASAAEKEERAAEKRSEAARARIQREGRMQEVAQQQNRQRDQALGRIQDLAFQENARKGAAAAAAAARADQSSARGLVTAGANPYLAATQGAASLLAEMGPLGIGVTAGGLAFAAAAFKITEWTREVAAGARETTNFAARLGITTAQARNLELSAQVAGINAHSLEASSRFIATALEDEGGAGKRASEAMARLGVATRTVSGEHREEGQVLLDLIGKLSNVKTQSELVRDAQLTLGRGSKEILPYIENYQHFQKVLQDLGIATDENAIKKFKEADEQLQAFDISFAQLKRSVAEKLNPIVIPIVVEITNRLLGKGDPLDAAKAAATSLVKQKFDRFTGADAEDRAETDARASGLVGGRGSDVQARLRQAADDRTTADHKRRIASIKLEAADSAQVIEEEEKRFQSKLAANKIKFPVGVDAGISTIEDSLGVGKAAQEKIKAAMANTKEVLTEQIQDLRKVVDEERKKLSSPGGGEGRDPIQLKLDNTQFLKDSARLEALQKRLKAVEAEPRTFEASQRATEEAGARELFGAQKITAEHEKRLAILAREGTASARNTAEEEKRYRLEEQGYQLKVAEANLKTSAEISVAGARARLDIDKALLEQEAKLAELRGKVTGDEEGAARTAAAIRAQIAQKDFADAVQQVTALRTLYNDKVTKGDTLGADTARTALRDAQINASKSFAATEIAVQNETNAREETAREKANHDLEASLRRRHELLETEQRAEFEIYRARAEGGIRLIEAKAAPGDEQAAESRAASVRIDLALKESAISQDRIRHEKEAADELFAAAGEPGRKAHEEEIKTIRNEAIKEAADLESEIIKERFDAETKIAELQKKNLEAIRGEAGKLFDVASQGGREGLRKYGAEFGKNLEKTLFQNTIGLGANFFTGGRGNFSAAFPGQEKFDANGRPTGELTSIGQFLKGIPLVGADPAKLKEHAEEIAREKNSGALDATTEALYALIRALGGQVPGGHEGTGGLAVAKPTAPESTGIGGFLTQFRNILHPPRAAQPAAQTPQLTPVAPVSAPRIGSPVAPQPNLQSRYIGNGQYADVRYVGGGVYVSPTGQVYRGEDSKTPLTDAQRTQAALSASLATLPHFGDGGIVTKPTHLVAGEDGPEIIIPLTKRPQLGFTDNQLHEALASSPYAGLLDAPARQTYGKHVPLPEPAGAAFPRVNEAIRSIVDTPTFSAIADAFPGGMLGDVKRNFTGKRAAQRGFSGAVDELGTTDPGFNLFSFGVSGAAGSASTGVVVRMLDVAEDFARAGLGAPTTSEPAKKTDPRQIPHYADGGIITKRTELIAGEAGPEVILPLYGEAAQVARGDVSVAHLIAAAANGTGARRPFLDPLLRSYDAHWTSAALPVHVDAMLNGQHIEPTPYGPGRALPAGYELAEPTYAVPGSDSRHGPYMARPSSEAEQRDERFDLYKNFLDFRQHSGGPRFPEFGKAETLASLPHYADGGIITKPTELIAGENGDELILPLKPKAANSPYGSFLSGRPPAAPPPFLTDRLAVPWNQQIADVAPLAGAALLSPTLPAALLGVGIYSFLRGRDADETPLVNAPDQGIHFGEGTATLAQVALGLGARHPGGEAPRPRIRANEPIEPWMNPRAGEPIRPNTNNPVDPEYVSRYRAQYEAGLDVPSPLVNADTGTIIEGHHRFAAQQETGLSAKQISAIRIPAARLEQLQQSGLLPDQIETYAHTGKLPTGIAPPVAIPRSALGRSLDAAGSYLGDFLHDEEGSMPSARGKAAGEYASPSGLRIQSLDIPKPLQGELAAFYETKVPGETRRVGIEIKPNFYSDRPHTELETDVYSYHQSGAAGDYYTSVQLGSNATERLTRTREILDRIQVDFPDAKTIGGLRLTGTRQNAPAARRSTSVSLPATPTDLSGSFVNPSFSPYRQPALYLEALEYEHSAADVRNADMARRAMEQNQRIDAIRSQNRLLANFVRDETGTSNVLGAAKALFGRSPFAEEPRVFHTPKDIEPFDVDLRRGSGPATDTFWKWKGRQGQLLEGEPLKQQDLPEHLYHVTTNAPGVVNSGMLLGQMDYAGLGGGETPGVSFTTSATDAHVIQRELTRAVRIARGDDRVGMDTLTRYAREDEREAGLARGTFNHAIESAEPAAAAIRQRVDAQPAHSKPDAARSLMADMFNVYLNVRESAAESNGVVDILKNPALIGSREQLARVEPQRIQILQIPSSNIPPSALITTGSDAFLHEIRSHSDVPIAGGTLHESMKSLRESMGGFLADETGTSNVVGAAKSYLGDFFRDEEGSSPSARPKPEETRRPSLLNDAIAAAIDTNFRYSQDFSPIVNEIRQEHIHEVKSYLADPHAESAGQYSNGQYRSVITKSGYKLLFKEGDPVPVPTGPWMGWPEEHWGVTPKEWAGMSREQQATRESKEQVETWAAREYETQKQKFYNPNPDLPGSDETESKLNTLRASSGTSNVARAAKSYIGDFLRDEEGSSPSKRQAWGTMVGVPSQSRVVSPAKVRTVPTIKEPVGLSEDNLPYGAKVPSVDFYERDLQDASKVVDESTIRRDYASGHKTARIYKRYIPMEDAPRPVLAELQPDSPFKDDEDGGYDWSEYSPRNTFPPAKIDVAPDGTLNLLDGNHRVEYWDRTGFQYAPAWVIDRRRGLGRNFLRDEEGTSNVIGVAKSYLGDFFRDEEGSFPSARGKVPAKTDIADLATWGASRIATGTTTFPKWSKQMVKDIGPQIQPQLQALWQDSQTIHERHVDTTEGKLSSARKLLSVYNSGEARADWYKDTKAELAGIFDRDTDKVIDFLAATSPATSVTGNVSLAMKAYKQLKAGEPFKGYLPETKNSLDKAAAGEDFGGPKVTAFRANLKGDPEPVTVDRWISRAFGFQNPPSPQQYKFMDYAMTQIADKKGVEPRQLQSGIWHGMKELQQTRSDTSESFETLIRKRIEADPALAATIQAARALYDKTPADAKPLKPPDIPKLQAGGIIPGSPQGTTVTAGENNNTEAIVPLDIFNRAVDAMERTATAITSLPAYGQAPGARAINTSTYNPSPGELQLPSTTQAITRVASTTVDMTKRVGDVVSSIEKIRNRNQPRPASTSTAASASFGQALSNLDRDTILNTTAVDKNTAALEALTNALGGGPAGGSTPPDSVASFLKRLPTGGAAGPTLSGSLPFPPSVSDVQAEIRSGTIPAITRLPSGLLDRYGASTEGTPDTAPGLPSAGGDYSINYGLPGDNGPTPEQPNAISAFLNDLTGGLKAAGSTASQAGFPELSSSGATAPPDLTSTFGGGESSGEFGDMASLPDMQPLAQSTNGSPFDLGAANQGLTDQSSPGAWGGSGLGANLSGENGTSSQVGAGLGVAAAAFGAYKGVTEALKGGAHNITGGIGTTAMAIAPLTGPIAAPFVMAFGAVMEGISALLGDPRQMREKQEEHESFNAEFHREPGLNITEDTSGHLTRTNFLGQEQVTNDFPALETVARVIGFNPFHPSREVSVPGRFIGAGSTDPLNPYAPQQPVAPPANAPVFAGPPYGNIPTDLGHTLAEHSQALQTFSRDVQATSVAPELREQNRPMQGGGNTYITVSMPVKAFDSKDVMDHAGSITEAVRRQLPINQGFVSELRNRMNPR